jgi:hypothetical protein
MRPGLTLWAFNSELPAHVLAVIGAAAVGAFLVGWLAQVAASLLFGQKVPRWPLWIVRALGGVCAGWLVALWLFGGGGGGLGGEGGFGLGGPGKGKEQTAATSDGEKKEKKEAVTPPGEGDTLRIEVLGDAPLKQIAKAGTFDAARRYRVAGERDLRTLDEVKELIRRRKESLARLEIVVYRDSPARDRPQVAELVGWARDLENGGKGRLKVDFLEPDRYAPLE